MELLTRNNFENWMQKVMERLDRQDEMLLSMQPSGKAPNPMDGIRLFDNQDLCMLLQMYRSGELRTDKKDTIRESSLIIVSPAELKGKRPLAVQFAPGEWIETPTWRKVAQKILQTCNEQPDIHERFVEMCGKVAGRWRTILGSSPEEMDVPIKVDEELYFEGKFDTEAMLNVLEKKVLEPAGVDYSSIKIRYMAKGQEQANGIEPVPEQDVLEHEEQEQHVPVQTM